MSILLIVSGTERDQQDGRGSGGEGGGEQAQPPATARPAAGIGEQPVHPGPRLRAARAKRGARRRRRDHRGEGVDERCDAVPPRGDVIGTHLQQATHPHGCLAKQRHERERAGQ